MPKFSQPGSGLESSGKQHAKEVELEEVQRCFRKYQSEKRTVDLERVEKILMDLHLHNHEVMSEFQTALYDNADQLDLVQFTNILNKLCGVTRVEARPSALRAAFDAIDTDHDGFITRKELKVAAPLLGIETKDVKAMMKAADTNRDGKVDFDEFRAMFG